MSCPYSIWCRDLNTQPLKHESSPITTRPRLMMYNYGMCSYDDVYLCWWCVMKIFVNVWPTHWLPFYVAIKNVLNIFPKGDNIAKLVDARFSKLVTFRALVWPSWQSCRGPWFESVHWLVEWLSNLRLKSRHSSELHRAQTLVGGDLFQTYLTIVV